MNKETLYLKPHGMPCIMNKIDRCGVFKNKADLDKWDGENFCRNNCQQSRAQKDKVRHGSEDRNKHVQERTQSKQFFYEFYRQSQNKIKFQPRQVI